MALILSACVLQDTVSSESPLGFSAAFLPYGEGGMFGWASTRHSPMLPLAWASPSMGDGHVERLGLRDGQLPLSALVCSGLLTSPLGIRKSKKPLNH